MPIRSLTQLREVPQPDWIWAGFIVPKGFTLFSAYPKVGKTTLIFHMLKQLCTGEGFLNRTTRPVPVLYISEEPDTLLAARADGLGFDPAWEIGWVTPYAGLNWRSIILYIKRWVYLHPESVIMIDTLARFWDAGSENDATQVTEALRPVLDIIRNSNAALLGIHHNRKQGGAHGAGVRGSTALTGNVDIIMELSRTSAHDRSTVRHLECESRYAETPNSLRLRLEMGGYECEDSELLDMEPQVISVLQTIEDITIGDIIFLLNVPDTTARRLITGLVQRGIVIRHGSGTARSPYRYGLSIANE